jgi:uncharacterized protein (DUF427 family)
VANFAIIHFVRSRSYLKRAATTTKPLLICESGMIRSVATLKTAVRTTTTRAMKENVQDYPRPPRLEPTTRHLKVVLNGQVVADTRRAYRVLETFHPPTYYIPPEDATGVSPAADIGGTMCEWKGRASYFNVTAGGETIKGRVWAYLNPTPEFKPIAGFYSFYAHPFECYVDDERVEPQPSNFYGGWKTSDIEGPIKVRSARLGVS